MSEKLERYLKRVKWLNCIRLVCVGSAICLLMLTPALNELANKSRVENGYGGECLLWAFPILILIFTLDCGGDR